MVTGFFEGGEGAYVTNQCVNKSKFVVLDIRPIGGAFFIFHDV